MRKILSESTFMTPTAAYKNKKRKKPQVSPKESMDNVTMSTRLHFKSRLNLESVYGKKSRRGGKEKRLVFSPASYPMSD